MHYRQESFSSSRLGNFFWGDAPALCHHRPGCVSIMQMDWWSSLHVPGKSLILTHVLSLCKCCISIQMRGHHTVLAIECSMQLPANLCVLVTW